MLFKQGITSCVVGTLWELTEEIKTFHCHHLTCSLCHRVEAEASTENPCEMSWQVTSFLCLWKCWQCKTLARTNIRAMPYRNSETQTCDKYWADPLRLKRNTEIILKKLKHLCHSPVLGYQFENWKPFKFSPFGAIFLVMVGQLSWAIWLWGLTHFGRCQRLIFPLVPRKSPMYKGQLRITVKVLSYTDVLSAF